MIGLKRGTVKLMTHDKNWSKLFEQEKKRVSDKARDILIDIQHIGSTAIPGIKAKPLIDILAGTARLKDGEKLIKPLNALGYKFYRKSGHEIFFAKGPDAKRTHYLHVVRHRGMKWKKDIFFRDYLRSHPIEAKKYEALKIKLAEKSMGTRGAYTKGKDVFIKRVLSLAIKN